MMFAMVIICYTPGSENRPSVDGIVHNGTVTEGFRKMWNYLQETKFIFEKEDAMNLCKVTTNHIVKTHLDKYYKIMYEDDNDAITFHDIDMACFLFNQVDPIHFVWYISVVGGV